jgi:hypothetical protein
MVRDIRKTSMDAGSSLGFPANVFFYYTAPPGFCQEKSEEPSDPEEILLKKAASYGKMEQNREFLPRNGEIL